MAKFMFLQRGDGQCEPDNATQDGGSMQAWQDWIKEGKESGWLLDPGSPLSGEAAIVRPDLSVIDGPMVEAKEVVGGFSIIEAEDLDAACEIAKKTMKIAGNGKIEVREFACFGEESE